jgi:excisionase family DNA binding protein
MPDEWISVKEAAAIRKVSERTFLNLIKRGDVEAKKDGRSWRVSRESAENVSEKLPKESEIVSILKAELQESREQVKYLQDELSNVRERSDTIILQMTLERKQLMLESRRMPWYRKLFRRGGKADE